MSHLPPLRDTASLADRALLRAEPVVPPGVQDQVLRRIEARIEPRPRSPLRWGLVLFGTLAAGTALAFGPGGLRTRLQPPRPAPTAPLPPRVETAAPGTTDVAPVPPPEAPRVSTRRPVAGARPDLRAPRPIERPGLDWPPGGLAASEPAGSAPSTPSAHLVVARAGRPEMRLLASATTVSGQARGTTLALRLEGPRLRGHIGEASVDLWLRGRRRDGILLEGLIDGRESWFLMTPTPRGQRLSGAIPGHTVALELGPGVLSWFPGCDEPLALVAPGAYEGPCASGGRARVEVPSALSQMPVAQRMAILAILLTEIDPVLQGTVPHLFPDGK